MTSFGIDFGTTNSVLATCSRGDLDTVSLNEPPADWASLGFDRVLPSVLAVDRETSLVGWQAKVFQGGNLEAVKRLFATEDTVEITGRPMPVEQAAALIFKHIQQQASHEGLTLDHAVVTVPANSRGRARMRTKVAAGLAGIEVAALINEPTAAAMAYGRLITDRQRVLVFDWGGGTLDVTILQSVEGVFMERASKGIQRLGGIDLDRAFAEHIQQRIGGARLEGAELQSFMLDVERAKVVLSSSESTNMPVPGGTFVELTRDELDRAVRPLIEQTRQPIDTCLNDLGGNVSIDHVVLVGGSSKIPAVREFVTGILGQEPADGVDPMTAVAEGAALAAGILTGEVTDNDFFVSTEHALGTIAVDSDTGEEHFSVLIPRNNMLPADATDNYSPVLDYQETVRVRVIEGDPDQPLDHDDNVILEDWEVKLAEPRPSAEAGIAITYQYDVDGILRVLVRDRPSDVVLLDDELAYGPERKRELGGMRRSVDELVGGAAPVTPPAQPAPGQLDKESQALVDRVLDKIIPFVTEDEQRQINEIIDDLRNSTAETRAECKRRLGAAMREHAYLL